MKTYAGSENYMATVAKIPYKEEIPGMDLIVKTSIFGNTIVISKDVEIGALGLYFNSGTQISTEFLAANNLFKRSGNNSDATAKPGFFDDSGRVKALKLAKGTVISTGFWIPIKSLAFLTDVDVNNLNEGDSFNEIAGHFICKKYVLPIKGMSTQSGGDKTARKYEKLLPNQFRFHEDTSHLAKNLHEFSPDQIIAVTSKFHGTSAIFSNVRVKRILNWKDRIAKFFGVHVEESEFAYIFASRKVIKSVDINSNEQSHFYNEDIWSTVGESIKHSIQKGHTIYGEIVGFTASGGAVQSGYDYGCAGNQHAFYVYRITHTEEDGTTVELSWQQIKDYCKKHGLNHVHEYYFGSLREYLRLSEIDTSDGFLDTWFTKMKSDFNLEKDCEFCKNVVPAEGVCVRIDGKSSYSTYKLKSDKFKLRESEDMDKGIVNMEDSQSEANN